MPVSFPNNPCSNLSYVYKGTVLIRGIVKNFLTLYAFYTANSC